MRLLCRFQCSRLHNSMTGPSESKPLSKRCISDGFCAAGLSYNYTMNIVPARHRTADSHRDFLVINDCRQATIQLSSPAPPSNSQRASNQTCSYTRCLPSLAAVTGRPASSIRLCAAKTLWDCSAVLRSLYKRQLKILSKIMKLFHLLLFCLSMHSSEVFLDRTEYI